MNNRARRSHELFGRDDAISREEFIRYKFDQAYSTEDFFFTRVITPLVDTYSPRTPEEKHALDILRDWDGIADMDAKGTTLANLIYHPIFTRGYSEITKKLEKKNFYTLLRMPTVLQPDGVFDSVVIRRRKRIRCQYS